ncbi:MAG: LysM peptidoglycan-binding domain-containing protein [Xanthomonadales bacterium]|nr:LysM peptidoglycan-binding domain-containing protein [Xanthomonadales bacterium]
MSILDSIKNAFGGKSEADITLAPGQILADAGIDPAGLSFNSESGVVTVYGEVAGEAQRQRILELLSAAPGIGIVEDHLVVTASAESAAAAPAETATEGLPESAVTVEADSTIPRSYTVKSGDTLWQIAEEVYGDGARYMKIFEANSALLEAPDRIHPGQELKIPEL